MYDNFIDDFSCNEQSDSFCIGKKSFAAVNVKAKPQLFKQLEKLAVINMIDSKQ